MKKTRNIILINMAANSSIVMTEVYHALNCICNTQRRSIMVGTYDMACTFRTAIYFERQYFKTNRMDVKLGNQFHCSSCFEGANQSNSHLTQFRHMGRKTLQTPMLKLMTLYFTLLTNSRAIGLFLSSNYILMNLNYHKILCY